jgi:hypothetical protein
MVNMPELRIVSIPQSEEWRLTGHLFGRTATIAQGSLYAMLRKRAELEAANA